MPAAGPRRACTAAATCCWCRDRRRRDGARALVPPRGAGRDRRRGSTPPSPAPARRYTRLTIRGQRTRWASCSATGAMSFNWRLLLAPEAVLDYVVEHEVCHLEVMDHSPRFWAAAGVARARTGATTRAGCAATARRWCSEARAASASYGVSPPLGSTSRAAHAARPRLAPSRRRGRRSRRARRAARAARPAWRPGRPARSGGSARRSSGRRVVFAATRASVSSSSSASLERSGAAAAAPAGRSARSPASSLSGLEQRRRVLPARDLAAVLARRTSRRPARP